MPDLTFAELYAFGAQATISLLDRLEDAGREVIERRPAPRIWSAEEYARHLAWLDDTMIRVESLGLEPREFPEGFVVFPGQVLETHLPLETTRAVTLDTQENVGAALANLTPEAMADTVEDAGGRTVARNLARYLDRSAGARASALLALRLVESSWKETLK